MKETAEAYLGASVTQAIITVPAFSTTPSGRRRRTPGAWPAGLRRVLRIINEPTAAALAYGLEKEGRARSRSTTWAAALSMFRFSEIGDGVFEVKSTNGDTFLGGEDFDTRIMDYLADEFHKDQGIDLRKDRLALQRLKDAAEKAKIELSGANETDINLPYITADQNGPKHLHVKLNRAKLEAMVDDLIQETIEPCKAALKDAGLTAAEIDEVVLVGGQTRMPKVQETVRGRCSVASPIRGSTPTKWSPLAHSRPACCKAT